MIAPCFYCNKEMNTRKEDVMVIVGWCFEELLEKNKLKVDKPIPRILYVCSDGWDNNFEKKLQKEGCYWIYNKEI